MKQLLILSGKGGTGKTTVSSGLINLAQIKAYADCDVDAPNLHLAVAQEDNPLVKDFFGLSVAKIDPDKCISCDLCFQNCRFDAIEFLDIYKVDLFSCEGCRVCQLVCPVDAITMEDRIIGVTKIYESSHLFSTAQLNMGSGNSGLLVTEVKKGLKKWKNKVELSIIDGSPGIGCPVIASISGVDMVLIVTEPTLSGLSDMERIIKTSSGFQAIIGVCVNKFDLNEELTHSIKSYCYDNNIPFLGTIPYDKEVLTIINKGLSVTDKNSPIKSNLESILEKILKLLNLKEE